jgi:acyl carrier protein
MSRDEIEVIIIDALKRASPRPIAPQPASDLVADLGMSSIDVLEAVADLEDRFHLHVPAADLAQFRTVADASAYLHGVLTARGGA